MKSDLTTIGVNNTNGWWGDLNQSEQTHAHLDSAFIQLLEIKQHSR